MARAGEEAPDLDEAHRHLGSVLQLLTNVSLASLAELMPDEPGADAVMHKHLERLSHLSAQIQLDADRMNPKWNKTYGRGSTYWEGQLQDGRDRGGVPYYCPSGWARFSLKVCADDDFEELFDDWGYLYHGTKGKHVGSILTSGFRASRGLCYCGSDDEAVYMSPCIEYCGHPRYGSIEYCPETGRWVQVVLQCRVNPRAVWMKRPETMRCKEFGLKIDRHIGNEEMEWLFRPTTIDDGTGHKYIKDAIVCTAIMVRTTEKHPCDLDLWWSSNSKYTEAWNIRAWKVDPRQKPLASMAECKASQWKRIESIVKRSWSLDGDLAASSLKLNCTREENLGQGWMSPCPFAQGHMRLAWFLLTGQGLFVVKRYNQETHHFMADGLGITEADAFHKDVRTYLAAQRFADEWNAVVVPAWRSLDHETGTTDWEIKFLEPFVFVINGIIYFGEVYVAGHFVKWNSNAGEVNMSREAARQHVNQIVAAFSHFTFASSKGQMMVVDVQGWEFRGRQPEQTANAAVIFTDPQIHTRRFDGSSRSRKEDTLYKRYSVGNLGRVGMLRFFLNHTCQSCLGWGALGRAALDFIVADVDKYPIGKAVRSPVGEVCGFRFRLLVFPRGTTSTHGNFVSAFVELDSEVACGGQVTFPDVQFSITVENHASKARNVTKAGTHTFPGSLGKDRGWHDMVPVAKLHEQGWMDSHGSLRFSAWCSYYPPARK